MADITKPELSKKDKIAKGVALPLFGLVGLIFLAAIFGHGTSTSGNATAPAQANAMTPADTSGPATEAAAPPPTHMWQYREGREYGYSKELSEDDKRSGTAAASIQMYRFIGEKAGIYTVALETPSGLLYASCSNPCEVVKVHAGGDVQRFEFNPSTVVGGALTDAMSGQMEVYSPPAAHAQRRRGASDASDGEPADTTAGDN